MWVRMVLTESDLNICNLRIRKVECCRSISVVFPVYKKWWIFYAKIEGASGAYWRFDLAFCSQLGDVIQKCTTAFLMLQNVIKFLSFSISFSHQFSFLFLLSSNFFPFPFFSSVFSFSGFFISVRTLGILAGVSFWHCGHHNMTLFFLPT